MFSWLRAHETLLWWLGASSVVMFVVSLIAIPLIAARIPVDYFTRDPHQHALPAVPHIVWLVLKNLLGAIFLIMGLAMLVLPGQGIITILVGMSLMNFPGKHALIRRIACQPNILRTINWMRSRAGQPPLKMPGSRDA